MSHYNPGHRQCRRPCQWPLLTSEFRSGKIAALPGEQENAAGALLSGGYVRNAGMKFSRFPSGRKALLSSPVLRNSIYYRRGGRQCPSLKLHIFSSNFTIFTGFYKIWKKHRQKQRIQVFPDFPAVIQIFIKNGRTNFPAAMPETGRFSTESAVRALLLFQEPDKTFHNFLVCFCQREKI